MFTPASSCPTHIASCQPCQVLHARCSHQPHLVLHMWHHVSLVKSHMHDVHASVILSYTCGIMSALSSPTCTVFTPAYSCPTHVASCQPCQVLHAWCSRQPFLVLHTWRVSLVKSYMHDVHDSLILSYTRGIHVSLFQSYMYGFHASFVQFCTCHVYVSLTAFI